MWLSWLMLGIAAGVALAAVVARWQIRRALAKQLVAERRARGAERLAEIGGLTSGLAHEIKNPLSTIGLNAQLLSEAIEDVTKDQAVGAQEALRLQRRIATLRREVERLRNILTDFLAYAGEVRLDKREADVNGIVEELADFFMPQAVTQGVRVRTQLAPGGVTIAVDVAHVKQALLNLLLNGVQAMQHQPAETKELIVRVAAVRDAQQRVTAAQVHVIDTGPGIASDVVERMFTPYFTTKAGGSGLGLPTTRRLIESHGGKLEVMTEIGKGTDFVVTLPA